MPTELDPVAPPHRSRICAVVVSYNIGAAIHRCYDAIQSQVGHVLIIDNGSGETTRRELDKLAASDSVTLILNQRNEGIGHAYNRAVRWARDKGFEWILTLDHDSEATPGMIDELIRGYAALENGGISDVGIMAANLFDLNMQEYLFFAPREHGGLPLFQGDVLSSGSLIWLGVFDLAGPFNEDLFMYYVDIEFCRRVGCAGYGVYMCPEAVLLHREGSKKWHRLFGIDACYEHYGKVARYYLSRNTVYFLTRLRPSLHDFAELIGRLFKDHVNILLFDENRIPVFWFSLRGLVDGIRGKVGPLGRSQSARTAGNGKVTRF